jgi:hypothetical protein
MIRVLGSNELFINLTVSDTYIARHSTMYRTHMSCKRSNFNVLNLIRCKYDLIIREIGNQEYYVIPATPATGLLYITKNNPEFISGQIRVRGRDNGSYPFNYLEMIESIFGEEENTIEVCSGNIRKHSCMTCFTVDPNPETKPDLVADGQTLSSLPNNTFNRWRGDPPYNDKTAEKMYGTSLPSPIKLLKAGARVCKVGSLMFLLLGPQNYQWHPKGVKRIGCIAITVVPNNEFRALNIFYKYANAQ